MPKTEFPLSLGSDNHSGVHPRILQSLTDFNRGHSHAYGMDSVSEVTLSEWRRLFGPHVQIGYVFNGTAANVLSLKLFLQEYESCIVSDVSHLHVDECAAPEAMAGTKLWVAESHDGKLSPASIERFLIRKGDQHYAQPRMISLTQPTELGTVYSVDEIKDLIHLAKTHGLFVHIDGARLIHAAFTLKKSLYDITFALGVDVVSFGGTKNGLLGAEAILFQNKDLATRFKFLRKQMMQLPSKTRFLAAQFQTFLQQDLWYDIATNCCERALELAQTVREIPEVRVLYPVQSNAVFAQIPAEWIKPLRDFRFFYVWDEATHALRWMTSFDMRSEDIRAFTDQLFRLKGAL